MSSSKSKIENMMIVGNDRDTHGCIPSAGFTWCASKGKCLQPWEESCPPSHPSAPHHHLKPNKPHVGLKDKNGCISSAGYKWCGELGKCVREWETPCPDDEIKYDKVLNAIILFGVIALVVMLINKRN